MAVVVQRLVDSDVAGVMFTRNPMGRADERVIEASWGLGEAVVAGLVTPDHWVLDASGQTTQFIAGEKDVAIRRTVSGTVEEPVDEPLIAVPCLDPVHLEALHDLALTCDRVFGQTGHDIEFAFAGGDLYLLQRRPITRG
jgi:pyruvate,water dikinase